MARLTRMFLAIALLGCALLAAPVGAAHVSCGDTITQDTTLDSDLVDCTAGVTIAADGVTLDLGGHTIDAAEGAENGVAAHFQVDSVITNGTIRGFRFGVLAEEGDGVKLSRLLLEDNLTGADLFFNEGLNEVVDVEATGGRAGLNLDGRIHVADSKVAGNSRAGILLDYTTGTIEDSTIQGNGLGIELEEAYALITNNRILDNKGSGIEYGYWQDGDVVGNTIAGNGTGIHDRGTSRLTITGNLLRSNQGHGAIVNGLAPITGNRASWNGATGLLVRDRGTGTGSSAPCLVSANAAQRNAVNGIEIRGEPEPEAGCVSTRVVNNHVHHNGADGLLVTETGRDTAVVANRADQNGDDGIDVDGSFGTDTEPAWSPDGTRLAFRSENIGATGLYVVDAGGEGLRRLSEGGEPDWSPDGERIAFTAADGIRLISPDGTGERLLAPGTKPQWSPDGTEILFQAGSELRVADVDTGTTRLLATGSDAEWSPDGSTVVFFFSGISTINRDGTGNTVIASGTGPTWSPVGFR